MEEDDGVRPLTTEKYILLFTTGNFFAVLLYYIILLRIEPTNPRFRLEQKPQEPSELSIRQLMRECKEVLRLAVIERQKYISRVRAAIFDAESDRDFLDVFEQE